MVHRSWVGEQMLVPKLTFFGSCLQWFRNVSSYPKSYLDCQRLVKIPAEPEPNRIETILWAKYWYSGTILFNPRWLLAFLAAPPEFPPTQIHSALAYRLEFIGKRNPHLVSIRFHMQKMLVDLQYISSKKNPFSCYQDWLNSWEFVPRLILSTSSSKRPLWSATCEAIFT